MCGKNNNAHLSCAQTLIFSAIQSANCDGCYRAYVSSLDQKQQRKTNRWKKSRLCASLWWRHSWPNERQASENSHALAAEWGGARRRRNWSTTLRIIAWCWLTPDEIADELMMISHRHFSPAMATLDVQRETTKKLLGHLLIIIITIFYHADERNQSEKFLAAMWLNASSCAGIIIQLGDHEDLFIIIFIKLLRQVTNEWKYYCHLFVMCWFIRMVFFVFD